MGESYLAILWGKQTSTSLSLYSDADVALPSKEYSTAALRGATVIQVRVWPALEARHRGGFPLSPHPGAFARPLRMSPQG